MRPGKTLLLTAALFAASPGLQGWALFAPASVPLRAVQSRPGLVRQQVRTSRDLRVEREPRELPAREAAEAIPAGPLPLPSVGEALRGERTFSTQQ